MPAMAEVAVASCKIFYVRPSTGLLDSVVSVTVTEDLRFHTEPESDARVADNRAAPTHDASGMDGSSDAHRPGVANTKCHVQSKSEQHDLAAWQGVVPGSTRFLRDVERAALAACGRQALHEA